MSAAAHTPGPWYVDRKSYKSSSFYIRGTDDKGERLSWGKGAVAHIPRSTVMPSEANARLIAAAPELLDALREAVDLAWIEDSHSVKFDGTVMFGPYYDFSDLDGTCRQEFYGQYECIVWPGAKWSAYCTYEGSMWFEKFDSAAEAKEACMRLLDQVLPDHPAMKARAVIAKATGSAA